MGKLLFVTSSIFGADSKSRQLGQAFVDKWLAQHPGTSVVERDLAAEPLPHITGATMAAIFTPAEKRSPEQAEIVAFADRLIEELEAADTVLLAVPMYNFTIPSTLKAWIDHVARAGRTFRYTEKGPVGLLKGKRVFIVTSRGGVYTQGPAKALDFHEPYLRGMLGFLGLDDVTFVHAEGLAISAEAAAESLAGAHKRIESLVPQRVAA
jgi:FMN-dependent NADH-azoreductase